MALDYSYKHRLRQKEIQKIAEELNSRLGAMVFSGEDNVEQASLRGFDTKRQYDIIFVDNEIIAILVGEKPMLTVRGLLEYTPTKRYVTVDMGAIPYVCNGADVMAPGIVDADETIAQGDLVWVRDEKNKKPLAVGEALVTGTEMNAFEKGKCVKLLHWVGDDLWNCGKSHS